MKDSSQWRDLLIRTVFVVATVAIVVWVVPHDNRTYFQAEQGKPWKYAEFTAPYDFPIYKSEQAVRDECDSVLRQYEPYYNYNPGVEQHMVQKFSDDYAEGREGLPDSYVPIITASLRLLYRRGIMDQKDMAAVATDTSATVRIVNGKEAVSTPVSSILTPKTAYEKLFDDERLSAQRTILQRCNMNSYIVPNLTFDSDRSEASRNELLSSVALASGVVQKGQKIVDRGEIVTEKTYRIVESFKREEERRNDDGTHSQTALLGHILYAAILIACFTLYLTLYRSDYFDKLRNITMLYALIIIFVIFTAIFVRNTFVHVYILPYAMLPIFIRIFMDSRTAFMTHVTMILLCATMLQHPFEFIAVETVAGLVAINALRELSERSQLFRAAIVVTLAAMGVNLAFDWMHADTLTQIDFSTYNYLIVNGLALLFAYPLLYLIEKTFGFTSDITLVELSNTNNPLLRKMSEVAPGTFNHSIQVANLAGEIANKIGAKAQLVRTGALYHDIGKLQNPICFTENQSAINPHDTMNDIESAQVIISHVTEGLRTADKYGLPHVIRDFIATHHGQGKAKFFYIRYKNEHPDEPVDDLLFTYPGPNPFTREQACLMMADAVEAASRSLTDYSEQSIRQLVERIVDQQVQDGFFRECPITFRDIQYAKTVLTDKLKTVYHSRVSYPTAR